MTLSVLNQASGDNFTLYNADCVEVMRELPEASIHLTVTSPPYLQLFTYSPSPRDVSNCKSDEQFWEHFHIVLHELFRITKPGRIAVMDVMNVPTLKHRDGHIATKDFRGDVIRAMQAQGFLYHSETLAWKDPLIEASRTNSIGLLHKQLCKDSTMSRAGLPQYLLAFRKPGVNTEPVAHENGLDYFIGENPPATGNLSHERWRRLASPVWMDINFMRTLNVRAAREEEDERHLCPMALDLIERAIQLWSNPGDVCFDPFSGVGSTGFCALQAGRKAIGVELKTAYWEQAVKNLQSASNPKQVDLFDDVSGGHLMDTAIVASAYEAFARRASSVPPYFHMLASTEQDAWVEAIDEVVTPIANELEAAQLEAEGAFYSEETLGHEITELKRKLRESEATIETLSARLNKPKGKKNV